MAGNKALNKRVNLQVDTTAAKQQIAGLYNQLNQLTSVNGISRNGSLGITQDIIQATKAAASLKVALRDAINPITGNLNLLNFSDSLKASGMQLADFKSQLSSLGVAGNQAFNGLARSVMMAEQPLTRTNKLASTLWTTLGNTMRWQATSMAIHGIVNTASQAMGYVKALDKSLNSIQIVTGQSAEQMGRFAAQANKAAKELNTTTNEYAKASLIYYQQGLSNKQVEERTRTTIKLANVAGQSAKSVSDQMTAVWNNFYDGGKSLEYYADVITALGASTASSSEEIAKGLQKFSSIAKTTGLSYEYATSALSTVVAATRQSADSVGTSFKTLFSRLQGLKLGETLEDGTNLNKYSSSLLTVGVNIKQANGELKNMDTILSELGVKWKSLAQDEKVALAQTIGGARNYSGLMALMDNWDSFQTNLQTAQTAQGTLQMQADIYAQSWEAASKHVRSASETIYKNLLDDKVFKGLTNGFGSVLDIIGNITNSLGGFGGIMSTLTLGATKLWQPQLSNFIDRNIIAPFSGKNQSDIIQQEAARLLNMPSTFSAYSGVNRVQTEMNQNFVQRQQTYNKMVQEGRISPFMQSTYQQLFAAQDAFNDQAISGLEQYYANNIIRSGTMQSSAQAFNAMRGEILKGLDQQYKVAASTIYTDSEVGRYANDKYQEYLKNFTPSYNKPQPQDFSRWITNNRLQYNGEQLGHAYYKQYPEATNIANQIEQLFTDRTRSGEINRNYMIQANAAGEKSAFYARINESLLNADGNGQLTLGGVRNLGNYLISRQEASDLLGENSPINGQIKNFMQEYKTISNDTALSDDERNKQLIELGTKYSQDISTMVSKFDASTETPIETEKRIRSDMISRLGLKEEDLSEEQKKTINDLAKSYRIAGEERGREGDAAKTRVGEGSLRDKGQYREMTGQKTPNQSLGTGITQLTSSLAGLTMGISAVVNSFKTLSDESATVGQKISAIGTGMFGLTQITSGAGNIIANWNKQYGESGITGGQLFGRAAISAAVIGAAIAVYQAAEKRSDENNVTRYSEMLATAQQTTSDTKAKQENLKVSQENYSNLRKKLSETTTGSSEYFNTLNELNTLATSLIDTYGLQLGKDFTLGENNLINLNPGSMQMLQDQVATAYRTATTNQQVLLFGRQFNQAQLEQNEYREKQLREAGKIDSGNPDITNYNVGPETEIDTTTKIISPEAQAKMQSAMSGMVTTVANDLLEQGIIQNADFSSRALLKELSTDEMSKINSHLQEYAINDWVSKLGNLLNGDDSLKNVYKTLQDQGYLEKGDISDFTEGQLKSGLVSAYWKYYLTNGEDIKGRTIQGVDFTGLKELNAQIGQDKFGLSNRYQYLTSGQIKEQLLKNYAGAYRYEDNIGYINELGSLILDVIKAEQNEAYSNLATAIRTNIKSDFDFSDKDFQEEIRNLTIAQAKQTTDYLTAAGAYGSNTAEFIFQQLRNTKFNQGTFNLLKQVNWDGSINGLKDIEQLAKNQTANSNFFSSILQNAIKDLGGEGGIFKTLYNTSGFQDVLESLKDEFASMGEITTESVVSLSKKSEELKNILHLSSSEFTKLNINAGGLAAVLTQMQKGTISLGQVTSGMLSSLSTANQLSSTRAEAFAAVDNLDLGRSGADYIDYFQAAGKAWYQAKKANLTNDEPLRNAIEKFLPTSLQVQYNQALLNGNGKDFSAITASLPTELKDFFATMSGRKGKGGGSMSDVIEFYSGLLQQAAEGVPEGFSSWYDWLNENGIDFNIGGGNIGLRDIGGGSTVTTSQMVERVQQAFEGMGLTSANAKNLANIFTAYVGDTSAGMQLKQADAKAAIATLQGYELNENGEYVAIEGGRQQQFTNGEQGGKSKYISEGDIKAAYESYGAYSGYKDYKDFKNAVLSGGEGREKSKLLFTDEDFWGHSENISTYEIAKKLGYEPSSLPGAINADAYVKNILADYGAIGENGKLDYSRFLDFIQATGGTEAQAQEWLNTNWQNFGDILNTNIKDSFGHEYNIKRQQDETYDQYMNRVNQQRAGIEQGWYFDTSTNQYVEDPGGYLRDQYYKQVQGAESYWEHKNEQRAIKNETQGQYNRISAEYAQQYNQLSPDDQKLYNAYLEYRNAGMVSQAADMLDQLDPATKEQFYNLYRQGQQVQQIKDSIPEMSEEDILGAAGGYAHTIGERMQAGLGVNAQQKALYDLYNQYQGLSEQDKQGDLGRYIRKAMDELIANTGEIADTNGQILEQGEDASDNEYEVDKNGNVKKKGQNGETEDADFELPSEERAAGGGGTGATSGSGGNGSGRKTLDEIIADAKANAPEGAVSTTVVDPNTGASYTIDLKDQQGTDSGGNTPSGGGSSSGRGSGGSRASGQNNNLLRFANGKDNFIAMTGELGPELRVKSDGTMDVLGQHGREYTWINPDDKIYTAAQTASILGNKTIEELQGFAHGINNFIPGFAGALLATTDNPGQGGGGWSPSRPSAPAGPTEEEDHRYDPNWLQYRDVIERYYTILQQIENITNAVTRFSEIADRAWGKERQKALTETIKLQEQQIEAQKKYVSEIQTYFKGDRNTLTTMMQEFVDAFNEANPNSHLTFEGAEFDENGVLTNYRAFAETLVDQFNERQTFKDKKEQYKFQEQLKDIQQYTETLNLLEEQETQLAKLEEALFDARLNEIQVVLEYKMSLDQNQQTLIDYALSKVKDDAYAAAEAVALIGEKQQILVEQLGDYEQAVRDILAVNQGGGRGINGVGLQLVDSNVGLALQSEFDDLKKWRDTFYDEETGEYKETAKIKDEISGKEVEHKWKEYSELLEKYYREYWNMYSDVLPDPDEFLNWTDTDDADKKIIENYEAVYNRLEQLQNQLNKSKIEYTYDKFTGILENSDEVTEQVQKHYEELLKVYPQLTDAIKEVDSALIDESTGRLNTISQYANLVNIINKINEVTKGQLSDEQYQLFLNNPQEFADWLMNPFENPDATPLTNAEVEQMQGYISSMLSNLTSIQENLYDVIDRMGDSAKAYFKDINAYLDKFDHYKDLYKNWANIIDLSGRAVTQIDHELMSGLYMKVTDNYINKLKGAKKAFGEAQDELKAAQDLYNERLNALNAYVGDDESIKQQYQNLFNQAEENLNNMYKIYTDAENNYYSSWEDALQGLADSFKEVVQNAAKNFEASFSPLFTTLELLQNAYDRQKELKDLYVDSYQQAHDLSKLNRDLANSIIDTDNLQGKQKLRDMQKEINKLQESGVKLSQYDLDVLQKKYDLELARQELEDAKNAKSLVRLARDNNGNWSYVYTASEDDVAAAEQKYEDAVLAMEQANEEYINNLQDQLFQVLQDAEAQIQALDPSQFQTEEDFNRAVQAIRDATVEKVNFINQQMNNALGNNNYLLDNVTGRARDLLDGLTSDYGDTILAMTSGMDDLTAFTALTIDNVDELASRTVVAFSDFWNRIGEVWQEAGHDILQAPTELSGAIKDIGEASSTTMEDISTAVDKASDAFDRLTESITTFFDSLDLDHLTEMISYYENWSQSLTDFIEYMGDWEQETGILKFNGDITQWGQMNQIYKILQDYGTAMLQYIDENGNTVQKELIAGSEETQVWLQQQREKIVTELANYKDLTTLTFDSQKKLDKAIDAINDKLNNQGLMNIDIKGDVFTKLKDEGVLDDFANMVIARDNDKKTATIQLDKVQNLDQVNAFLEKLEEVMKVKPSSSGGGGYMDIDILGVMRMLGFTGYTPYGNIGKSTDTGGYTGRWQSADTGMYTGEWPDGSTRRNGRLAWLHQKELVLNAHDTENFLDAMKIVRQLDNLTNWMANGLGMLAPTTVTTEPEELEQNVHIEASFPNVTNHSEIEQAFDNLVNLASQYANRK